MTKLPAIERRTALKTIGAGIVGSATLVSTVTANGGRGRGGGPRNVVEVETKHPDDNGDDNHADHYIFEFSKTEIEAGWTTFILENQSGSTHLAPTAQYLPDTVDILNELIADTDNGIDTYREAQIAEVATPFQVAFDDYLAGEDNMLEFFIKLEDKVADWFMEGGAVPVGGPGLIQGGKTARTTMYLEPGLYFMECYVLDDKGVFHTDHMVETFVVKDEGGHSVEPNSHLDLSISTENGIELGKNWGGPNHNRRIVEGDYRFGVTFEDNTQYGHGLGHDVNLIRLDGDAHIDDGDPETDVNIWVNYLDAVLKDGGHPEDPTDFEYGQRGALTSTSADPGPGTWLGGVQDIFPPEGESQTAYFEATLKPGDYALVAEIPDPLGHGFVEKFTVRPRGRGK